MRGIIKGSAFAVILMAIVISVISVINIYTDIPLLVLKGALWVLLGICGFSGSLLVARSADTSGMLKGIGAGILSILSAIIIIRLIAGTFPSGPSFYVFLIIYFVCSLLGALTGAKS